LRGFVHRRPFNCLARIRQDHPVRILVASDLHYRLPHYDWLVKATQDVDVVALAGDLADVVNPVPFEVQTVVLERYLMTLASRATVFAASGNHDLDGPGDQGEQVAGWLRNLRGLRQDTLLCDGSSIDLGGIRFTVCPWWDGPATRDAVAAQLAAAAIDRPPIWVWIYHAPPAGTVLCDDGRRTFPDHELAAWIEQYQPEMVLCGHIHQAPWIDGGSWHARLGNTWVFNAGKQVGPIPPHITIDTELGTAEWYGVFSSETISLS
jgi:Icc-related predicted phosphoesterase